MQPKLPPYIGVLVAFLVPLRVAGQTTYELTPDSLVRSDVPHGEVKGPFTWRSQVFPGTTREYWVYVPSQYRTDRAACVFVLQDGLGLAKNWHATAVLDNLIHAQEIPVAIGIFIDPGVVPAVSDLGLPRFNRSYEYDSLTDRYARLLIDEILPEVGKSYRLSDDPNDRAIAGASSGAICALNVAFRRPDAFRRVFSAIGTYVGLRGGDQFSTLVRKCEPKPLRVFLQDGRGDLDLYAGGWWPANQQMLAAMNWAGYDVHHAWGDGGHDAQHAAAIFPEALRWLWRGYPAAVEVSTRLPQRRIDLVIPGEVWQLVSAGHEFCEGPAVSPEGDLYFSDVRASRILRVDAQGKTVVFADETGGANGLMFGPDGKLYACAGGKNQIASYDRDGRVALLCADVQSNDLVTVEQGVYFTDPRGGKVHFVDWRGQRRVVAEGLGSPNGVAVSPDRAFLYVADTNGATVHAFRIESDNSLAHGEPLFALQLGPERSTTGADGMTVDSEGRLYVTTDLGVQVCDPLGRVHLIMDKPQREWLSNVVLGGKNLDTLYATCGGSIYKRKVRASGFLPWSAPQAGPRPKL